MTKIIVFSHKSSSTNLDRFLLISFVSRNAQIHLSVESIVVLVVRVISWITDHFMHPSVDDLRWLFHYQHSIIYVSMINNSYNLPLTGLH